jgi:trans-L-3-hydroxyproline dehydratase
MCGHATIALGRFLVDTHDLNVFPRRDSLIFDPESWTTKLLLHTPCGIVEVTVPVLGPRGESDPSRPVSFLSVPSFATALDLPVSIPASHYWPELGDRGTVTIDLSYGGAFYALISASELGFASGLRPQTSAIDIDAMSRATALLKDVIMTTPELKGKVMHPAHEDLSYLYSVVIVDDGLGVQAQGTKGVETGLCFFADQQVDRSPTGSCVVARIAVAYARRRLGKGDAWTYHSVVSNAFEGEGGFVGRVEAVVPVTVVCEGVVVRTEGKAWYTGASTFTVEKGDKLGYLGFDLREIASGKS